MTDSKIDRSECGLGHELQSPASIYVPSLARGDFAVQAAPTRRMPYPCATQPTSRQ